MKKGMKMVMKMKMRVRVYPYKQGSKSAKALAVALDGKVLRRVGSKYRRNPEDLIINWGAPDSPFKGRRVANQPESIETASNKLTCLETLLEAGVSIPPFWTRLNDIPANSFPIVCRKLLTASEGRGIVIADRPDQLVPAPLYTRYIKKKDEYRVHVLRSPGDPAVVISIQRKAKRNGADADFRVRNLANGFVFIREEVYPPDDVCLQARCALEASGLAFGAVDVIWNEHEHKAYVLEINTAPGLQGQTVEDYANAFRGIL